MATLTDEMKGFLVSELAMFATPTQAAQALKEQFGVEINRNQAYEYNPEARGGRRSNISNKWRVLFQATRKRFLKDVTAIPIASRAFRLWKLDSMLRAAEARDNLVLAARLLEQAAKECGDVFTNRHTFKHSGSVDPAVKLTPDQLRDGIMALVQKARQRALAGPEQG